MDIEARTQQDLQDEEQLAEDLHALMEEERLDESSQKLVDEIVARLLMTIEIGLGIELFPYQQRLAARILESLIIGDGEQITALQSRQSGKSETVACTVAVAMIMFPVLARIFPTLLGKFKKGVMVGVFAPVEEQAETLFQRIVTRLTSDEATEMMLDEEIGDKVIGTGKLLRLQSGSFCRMQTANPRAKIESKSYHLVIVDEAQDADDRVVRKCVAEGTPVWLPDGTTRPVEEVVRRQLDVLTYDRPWDLRELPPGRPKKGLEKSREIGELVAATPTEWHDNGVQPVWRITTSSGRSLEVTENHRHIVRWRRGNSLPVERTTSDLVVGMQLPVPLDVSVFGDRGDRDLGYFCGQMVGDGCTTDGRAQWCGHDNGAMSEMIRIAESWGDSWNVYTIQDSGLHEGAFIGGNAVKMLHEEGLLRRKGIEKGLYHDGYSEEFTRGYVAGLIDSDGSVGSRTGSKRVEVALISERAIRQAQDMLLRLGVLSAVFRRQQNGGFGDDPHDLWVLTIKDVDSLRRLREVIHLHDELKDQALTKLVEDVTSVKGRRSIASSRREFGKGRIAWDRITSIEYVGEKPTYCVTVEPSHTVLWNGFVGLQSIHPMLAFYRGTIVKTGTPTTHKGDFYRAIQLNKRRQTKRGARQNHFEANWRECAKYNKDYAGFIKQEMLRLGPDSDEFQLSYELRWLLDRGMFTPAGIMDPTAPNFLGDKSMEIVKQYYRTPVVAGVDPAREKDSTVVTVLWVNWHREDPFGYREARILNWLEITNQDWESQYAQIVDFLSNYDVIRMAVDSTGMGDAVAERLQVLMGYRTEVIKAGSTRPDQTDRWKKLTAMLERRLLSWPAHAKTRQLRTYKRFTQQMEDLEKVYVGGYLLAQAPDEAEAHDDYADSLALAISAIDIQAMPTIEVYDNPFFTKRRR